MYLKYSNPGVTDFFRDIFDYAIWWDGFNAYKMHKNHKPIDCALMHSKIKSEFHKFLTIILED